MNSTNLILHALFFPLFLLLSLDLSAQTNTVNYNPSSADFPNPERGFYRYSATYASNYTTLDSALLAGYRSQHSPSGANYSIYSSLVFRYFVLDDFKTSAISQAFLDSMEVDFAVARAAGVKLIVRFAYTLTVNAGNCPAEWVCPPYGDAPKNWVLTHIDQLKPVLETNYDVIAVVQMGFIGIWGEGYYTDYFGDASVNGQGYLSNQNWTDRKEILQALLDAVPSDRMVQVRYPQLKQKMIFGNTAPTTSAPISNNQAHNGSTIARIGFHNDCLLASADDFGTYTSYDNPPTSDTANLKPYLTDESKYVAVGGETCFEYNPFNNCASTGGGAYGDTEIKRMHYSYLNAEYNNEVNNDWVGICMDDIRKKMGYRFALQNGTYDNDVQPGQVISIDINLVNEGFAAPFNPRGVELVLRNTATNEKWFSKLPEDPRFWLGHSASKNIKDTLCVPANLPAGTYDLSLNLPDPVATIYDRPEYAIRLASELPGGADVWDPTTGYNALGHSLVVNTTASRPTCNGETGFLRSSSYSGSCVSNLSITGLTLLSGAYQSQGELTTSDTAVGMDEAVTLQSDTGVLLSQNVEVPAGSELEVLITPCLGN